MRKIYAVVQGKEKPLFVTTLTEKEMDDLGDYGVELLVSEWCDKKGFVFIDYAL